MSRKHQKTAEKSKEFISDSDEDHNDAHNKSLDKHTDVGHSSRKNPSLACSSVGANISRDAIPDFPIEDLADISTSFINVNPGLGNQFPDNTTVPSIPFTNYDPATDTNFNDNNFLQFLQGLHAPSTAFNIPTSSAVFDALPPSAAFNAPASSNAVPTALFNIPNARFNMTLPLFEANVAPMGGDVWLGGYQA